MSNFANILAETIQPITRLYATQLRKGTSIPYITHPWAVAALVAEYGGTEDQIIAALLHASLEDPSDRITIGEIRNQCGDSVARLVYVCHIPTNEMLSWDIRKQLTIDGIPGTPDEAKLVITADHLATLQSIARALRMEGTTVWTRFTHGPKEQLGYYRGVLEALRSTWRHPILAEYHGVLESLELVATLPL